MESYSKLILHTILYNKPKNMFVAGFIGSPQMNLLDAICKVKDGEAYLEVGNK